jgi:hypothetical protein
MNAPTNAPQGVDVLADLQHAAAHDRISITTLTAVAELMKQAERLEVAITFPGLVKPSTKNPNAGFVDMRDWYALMAQVQDMHAALSRIGSAK